MRIKFCEFPEEQLDALYSVLNTIYEVNDFAEIMNVYDVFKKDFPGPTVSVPQNLQREKLQPRTNQDDFLSKYNDFDFQVGIDLPVLLSSDCNYKGTVFIVAEDPLRDFFKLSNGVRLATPFGVHMQEFRNEILRIYWQVIEHFLEQGFNVYVTDFYKLWIKRRDNPKLRLKGDLYEKFYTAFVKENETFKPQLIITFGKPVSLLVERIVTEAIIIAFPHPTRTANGKWKKVLKDFYKQDDIRCTDENKLKYMMYIIKSTMHNRGAYVQND